MVDSYLTQREADYLFGLEKWPLKDSEWDFPTMGMKIEIPLASSDKKEIFSLDIGRGTIDLGKIKYQNRARHVIILARLELSGAPHRNPDDTEVPAPHIHRYVEGYGDKWAYPLPLERFSDLGNQWTTLLDFMRYCNIISLPNIKRVMF